MIVDLPLQSLGIILGLGSVVVGLNLTLWKENPAYIIVGALMLIPGVIMVEYGNQQDQETTKHNAALEKISIDSMKCSQLGDYLIQTADNKTSNYAYAQAKYLVCTRGGLSP